MKTRINDLARELEVKSREILESLQKLGIAGNKTHSSSLEADEAEKVRKFLSKPGAAHGSASGGSHASGEFHPKIDLSKISKPGDVLRALTEQRQGGAASAKTPVATVEKPKVPVAPRVVVSQPTAATVVPPKTATVVPPKAAVVAPPKHEGTERKPRLVTPATVASAHQQAQPARPPVVKAEPPAAPAPVAPPAVIVVAPAEVVAPVASAAKAEPVAPDVKAESKEVGAPAEPAETVAVSEKTAVGKAPAAEKAAAKSAAHATKPASTRPGTPIHGGIPGRRMIVPQTGPRPVYTAPPPRPVPTHPTTPMRGAPIYQRPGSSRPGSSPRPGATGGYQRPGGPRPMHPTRTMPTPGGPGGYRPGGAGRPMGTRPGVTAGSPPAPGTTRPAARPPSRRPGQRYVPKGRQEGPMKGFVPPPRLSMSSEPLPITRTITIADGISVKDLAEKLEIRAKDLIARLLARGVFATINQNLDSELAHEMARQFGADTSVVTFEQQVQDEIEAQALENNDEAVFNEVTRAPVVTIMGHVDHGKTSLLDAIRRTDVAGGEAGGITQHIGAYKVRVSDPSSPSNGRQIVFLDTPGHEAFTRMRARGAKGADIVILVVAADDGVMPQTLEAVDHAKAAKVPIIVAVNKIDKPGADPERVKKQLADRGLLPEAWGGDTVFVDVSAKAKTNLSLLMEMICLVADMQNLKATPDRLATGVVLEAKLDRGRGPVATVLVDNGTLKSGETFVVGNILGKVRAMFDDRGRSLDEAGPSTPVEILGLEGLPQAGDKLIVVADRDKAREISEYREQKAREAALAKSSRLSLEGLAEQIESAGVKELPVILKGDVQGSAEVIGDMLNRLSTEKVKINLLRSSVGAITESDVLLASASNAVIIGFNVKPERKAQEMADQEKVDIRLHSIIYELSDEIKKAMAGLLEPIIKETYAGRAEVRQIFRIPKIGTVAGCQVTDGSIRRDAEVRLIRDGEKVFQGRINALKRFKDDAKEVSNGMECGISLQGHGDIKVGDIIEAFSSEKIAATL